MQKGKKKVFFTKLSFRIRMKLYNKFDENFIIESCLTARCVCLLIGQYKVMQKKITIHVEDQHIESN